MPKFEKYSFTSSDKHGLLGSFITEDSIRHDCNVEIAFSKLEAGFQASPHIHTQSKTVVIVLKGGMTFSIDGVIVEVRAGEYIIFDKGSVEAVIAVEPETQNLTIHTPSIVGGDKEVLESSSIR
jgi:quercetin dioxygenase-like cupin family protein